MPDHTLSIHCHSIYSQRDAILKPKKAAEKIKAAGCSHYAMTDHGTIQGWIELRDVCAKNGLVPVYGCELYVNDSLDFLSRVRQARDTAGSKSALKQQAVLETLKGEWQDYISKAQLEYLLKDLADPKSLAKTAKQILSRLAYGYFHLVAVAYTEQGRQNLIRLVNHGWMNGYYYKPQVRTSDCLALSEGIIFTTACMGGPIGRYGRIDPTGALALEWLKQWEPLKDRMYLEVQPLDLLAQRRHNEYIISLHNATGFPLTVNQDNHHLEHDEWMAHRVMMLCQNNEPIDAIEPYYDWRGQVTAFSDLKKALGFQTTWQTEAVIEQEQMTVAKPAGHFYKDVKLHWRTNDDVRKECEWTNPELLPVLDKCFETSRQLCETIPDIPWSSRLRMPKHEGARERVLRLCSEELSRKGLAKDKIYVDWLKKEDRVISACGFYDYIWTLRIWTRKVQDEGIPIGYARGSGGGCLIMYLLGIIRVNPVKYGLYFERFLNPARLGLDPQTLEKVKEMASVPDVDLDFSSIHRDRVIQIAKELFGEDHVFPVGTVGTSLFKTALADVCRAVGISQAEFMPVSKELPDDVTGKLSFEDAMKVEKFKEFVASYRLIAMFLPPLIGTVRSTGKHAGGVCIADVPVANHIPIVRSGSKDGAALVTGFGESGGSRDLESIGYVKFDALATDTVDHISLCARLRYQAHLDAGGEPWVRDDEIMLYPEQMPDFTENDPAVMTTIFHAGNTDGVFQMEENIGKSLCALVKPNNIEEVSDISTMIRPGCLQAPARFNTVEGGGVTYKDTTGLHFEYAARKFYPQHNTPPELPESVLEVLRPTHFCCIYQEQMMFLIQVVSGGKMSLGEGDIYRRNIELWGKKREGAKEKCMEIERQLREASPYPAGIVDQVCTIIKGGANYSFNKSHSLSYSLFSYGQAWFKYYFPHIFYAAHITLLANKGKSDKVHKIVNNARSAGIAIQAPHVKHSGSRATWSEDGKRIYLPFVMMKGFKEPTALAIAELGKDCETVEDFLVKAIQSSEIKKNHIISLAKAGALDDMGRERLHTLAMASYALGRATKKTKEAVIRKYCAEMEAAQIMGEIDHERALQFELEVFGGFVNECPLDRVSEMLEEDGWLPLSQIEARPDEPQSVYFMVTSIQKRVHKSGNSVGKEWFRLVGWDGHDVCEVCVWNYDLDGTDERIGYRGIIEPHGVYRAYVGWDGNRPKSLSHRSWIPVGRDTLMRVPTGDKW